MEDQLARVQTLKASIELLEATVNNLQAQLNIERAVLRTLCQHAEHVTVFEGDYYHQRYIHKCTVCGHSTNQLPFAE